MHGQLCGPDVQSVSTTVRINNAPYWCLYFHAKVVQLPKCVDKRREWIGCVDVGWLKKGEGTGGMEVGELRGLAGQLQEVQGSYVRISSWTKIHGVNRWSLQFPSGLLFIREFTQWMALIE